MTAVTSKKLPGNTSKHVPSPSNVPKQIVPTHTSSPSQTLLESDPPQGIKIARDSVRDAVATLSSKPRLTSFSFSNVELGDEGAFDGSGEVEPGIQGISSEVSNPGGEIDKTFKSDLHDWWQKQPTLSPKDKLAELEKDFPQDLAARLFDLLDADNSGPHDPAYALLVEMSEREDLAIPVLVATARGPLARDQLNSAEDIVVFAEPAPDLGASVRKLVDDAMRENLQSVQAESRLRLKLQAAPSQVRRALAQLGDDHDDPDRALYAAVVRYEMLYRDREKHGRLTPMTRKKIVITSIQVGANGIKDGLSQYLSRLLVHGGYLAAVPAFGLTARYFLSTASLLGTQLFSFWRVQSQRTPVYNERPMLSLTLLQVLSFVVPAVMSLMVLVAHAHDWPVEVTELVQGMLDVFAFNEIQRMLRELGCWFRSNYTAGFDLLHADGTGLTASEQRWVNMLADGLYTVTSMLLLCGGQTLAREWIAKISASVDDIKSAFMAAAMLNIFTGLNDMCEGWTTDIAKAFCKLVWGDDYELQPGTQPNPGLDPTLYLNHAASRCTTGPIIDLFTALAALVAKLGGPHYAVEALLAGGAFMNGGFGRLRGRWTNYFLTDKPIYEDGRADPRGMMSAMTDGAWWAAKGAWNAVAGAALRRQIPS